MLAEAPGRGDLLRGVVAMGYARLSAGDPKGALALFGDALKQDGARPDARLGRANAWLESDKPRRALRDVDAVLAVSPHHARALILRARACRKLGDLAGETAAIALAVDTAPNSIAALRYAAMTACGASDFGAALGYLDRAMALCPDKAGLRRLAVLAHTRRGDHEAALVQHRIANELDPGSLEDAATLGPYLITLAICEQDEEVVALSRHWLDTHPDARALIPYLHRCSVILGNSPFPLEAFEAAFEADPQDLELYNALRHQLSLRGDADRLRGVIDRYSSARAAPGTPDRQRLDGLDVASLAHNPRYRSAYDALCAQGVDLGPWARWIARVSHGRAALKVLREGFSLPAPGTARHDEVLRTPDFGPLLAHRDEGRGLIIAATHLDPSPVFLGQIDQAVGGMIVAAQGAGYLPGGLSMNARVALQANRQASRVSSLRRLATQLRAGGVVSGTGDGVALSKDSRRISSSRTFAVGRERFTIDTVLPRLAYSTNAKSVFTFARWRGGKLALHFRALPDPHAGERRDAFVQRWSRAYMAQYRALMLSEPEAFDIGGQWRACLNDPYAVDFAPLPAAPLRSVA